MNVAQANVDIGKFSWGISIHYNNVRGENVGELQGNRQTHLEAHNKLGTGMLGLLAKYMNTVRTVARH